MRHHFTVDVEEYFQVSAFEPLLARSTWDRLESRIVPTMTELLALLEEWEIKGTMFILGWLAKRHPALIRQIAAAGHEIASHGWDHRRIPVQGVNEFRDSVRRTKHLLEDLSGAPVVGFRAPSFSITQGFEWALDVLVEEGHLYDSSLFPIWRPGYGYAGGAIDPYQLELPVGKLLEFPPATLRRLGINLPAGGGGYLRILPYQLIRLAILEAEARGAPATIYIHPWEIDPDQPRLSAPWHVRWRHYMGLGRTIPRLRQLFSEFSFQPISASL